MAESDIDIIDIRSQLEHQIQTEETREAGWIFDKINSMKISFFKAGESDGSSHVKIPLRSDAILNIQNVDKYCSIWFILAHLHPCNFGHPNRVSNYKQNFGELNIKDFDFTNRFKCSDVHKFEKLNISSINIFELIFNQDKNKWKHKLIPIEISKNDSDRAIVLII